MILAFEPPKDLTDFVWTAAVSAASAINSAVAAGKVASDSSVVLFGRGRKSELVSRARRIMAHLVRRHVWFVRSKSDAGSMSVSICFPGGAPELEPEARPLSTPMLAWITGNDHSALVRQTNPAIGFDELLDQADKLLSEVYQPGQIVSTATFRSRQRKW